VQKQAERSQGQVKLSKESQKQVTENKEEAKQAQENLSKVIQGNTQAEVEEIRQEVQVIKEEAQNPVANMVESRNEGQKACESVEAGEKILLRNTGIHEETLERKENQTMKIDTGVAQSDSGLQPGENKAQTDAGQIIRRLGEKARPDRTQDYVFQSGPETTVQMAEISAVNSRSNTAAKVNNQSSEPGAAASFKAIRIFSDECQCRTQDQRLPASNEITDATAEMSTANSCRNKFSEPSAAASFKEMNPCPNESLGERDAVWCEERDKTKPQRDSRKGDHRNTKLNELQQEISSSAMVNTKRRSEIFRVLNRYLPSVAEKLGLCNMFKNEFKMPTDRSIKSFSRPMSFRVRLTVRTQMQGITNEEILELSCSDGL
jgi:hypothetical protein